MNNGALLQLMHSRNRNWSRYFCSTYECIFLHSELDTTDSRLIIWIQQKNKEESLLWLCLKNTILQGKLCYFCVSAPGSNGILYPFEGKEAGKWKNCNTFLSFCLVILSQIRWRVVASVLYNTMRHMGLGKTDKPLQKIKKVFNQAVV